MSHTIKDRTKLLARVRRLKGQMESVERALEADVEYTKVLQLIASVRGALNGLAVQIIEDHIVHHVVGPDNGPDATKANGAADLIDMVRSYLK